MRLKETEALFLSLVTHPDAIEPNAGLDCFLGTGPLPVQERLRIYADMYLWRLVDALREDFPKLAALIGDDQFYSLVEAYLRRYPSEDPDIGHAGRHLVGFLRESDDPSRRADLAELAELEWTRGEMFLESDVQPIEAKALTGLRPEVFVKSRLRFVPALRLLKFQHDVAGLWKNIEDRQTPPPLTRRATQVAVWRKEFAVYHVILAPDEAEGLNRAIGGSSLEQVCAAFADRDAPAQIAFAALASWFAEGWVAEVQLLAS